MMIETNQLKRAFSVAFLLTTSFVLNAKPNNSILAILKSEDPVPQTAVKVKQISFTGNDFEKGCSYYELLLRAEETAGALGVNLMKVVAHTPHSRAQTCDELEVAFYNDETPRTSEQSFQWNADRPLTWEDFNGPIRSGSRENIAAETSCGIAIETNLVPNGGKAKVYVFNSFERRTSWVRPGSTRDDVLQHEQSHWDICELYTRKMQQRFDNTEISGATLNRKVDEIYREVSKEYIDRQEQYENDTQHGTIPVEQDRWTKMIREELHTEMSTKL